MNARKILDALNVAEHSWMMSALYDEMAKRETNKAKIYKTNDGLETLIQHNISHIST